MLVDRRRPQHRKDEIAHEFLAKVIDVDAGGPGGLCLLTRRLELVALTEIGTEGDHRHRVALDQPLEDHRRIQTARIGEDDLLGFVVHTLLSKTKSRDR